MVIIVVPSSEVLAPDDWGSIDRWRELPPEQRDAVKQRRDWYRSLPDDRKQELRDRMGGNANGDARKPGGDEVSEAGVRFSFEDQG